MSSRARNFRRRSDDDANGDDRATSVASNPPKLKPKPSKSKLLSFADDDEEDATPAPSRAPKPPPISSSARQHAVHKLTNAKDRASSAAPPPPVASNYQPQAGEYTKERLLELQKNARPLGRPAISEPDVIKPDTPSETVVVLKGLVKPVASEQEREVREVEIEDAEFKEGGGNAEHRRFAKLGIDGKGKDDGSIPDQATINAIRAKRERLRQSRAAAPDYISLDDGGSMSTRATGTGGSSDEESDFRGRISLIGNVVDDESKKGVFESVEQRVVVSRTVPGDGDSNDEDDDEERIWEEEQFRKALGKRLDDASGHLSTNAIAVAAPPIPLPQPALPLSSNSFGAAGGVSRSAEIVSFSQQAEVTKRAMQEVLTRLKESHGRTLSSLVMTEDFLSESLTRITDLEKALEDAGNKFVYVQKLRNYISILCDFLLDKTPYIEELEEQLQKLHEDRATASKERRDADTADEMAEVDAAVNAAMSVLSKGSGSFYISAATTAAQAASAAARESMNLPVQLDEFGRDLNLQKRMDAARRAEARKQRKLRSESKRMSRGTSDTCLLVEGECSTDESDSETDAYRSSQDEVLQVAAQILSNAADEYSDLSVVKERLEEWKHQYSSSYRDAYVSLSAPDIFSPYVRLELLRWDPLYEDKDFSDMKWHTLLFDYGLPPNGDNFDTDDPDANLIPELVEKVALPILHHEIAHCWDIFSTRMTQNAVSAAKLIINYIPPSSEGLRDFLAVVRSRLAEAVINLVLPRWSTTVLRLVPDAAQVAAYRFGASVRLLKNVCLWKNVLAMPVLEDIALVELLGGKIIPHLHSVMPNIHDAITRSERVIASLAGIWSGPKGEHSQRLQPLVDYIAELGRKLEKRHSSGVSEDTHGLARRLKKMLVDLNEYDKARAILRTFQIKEAL